MRRSAVHTDMTSTDYPRLKADKLVLRRQHVTLEGLLPIWRRKL